MTRVRARRDAAGRRSERVGSGALKASKVVVLAALTTTVVVAGDACRRRQLRDTTG